MTTLLVSSNFIIADKRISRTISTATNKHRLDHDVASTYHDHAVKICTERFVRKLTYDGVRVMAISYAGSVSSSNSLENYMRRDSITTLNQVMATSCFFGDDALIDLVAICEDGSSHVMLMGNRPKFTHHDSDRKTLICKGSGSQSFRKVFEKLVNKGDLTLEEVFLYLTMNDPYSSNDYSVYSLKDDHLYTAVCPTHDHCRNSALKVHAASAAQYDNVKSRGYGI